MNSSANPRQLAVRSKEFHNETMDELKYLGSTILHSTPATLWLSEDDAVPAWPDCVWRNVQVLEIESITDAQKKLKAISKHWRYYGDALNRRGALIAEKLVPKNTDASTEVRFPTLLRNDLPVFTMADTNKIFYSHEVQRPTVDGKILFRENKKIPPSRAYLKLWEALTIIGDWPKKNETVVDLGSSPGSWTWALSQLGANVLSIDRSPLDAKVTGKNISFKTGDAFSLQPTKMDWVFSDVICFPEKLYEYVQGWIASGLCEKFVCNVKFSGEVDPRMIDRFRKIPHSRVFHVLNGKKEVTWMRHPGF